MAQEVSVINQLKGFITYQPYQFQKLASLVGVRVRRRGEESSRMVTLKYCPCRKPQRGSQLPP